MLVALVIALSGIADSPEALVRSMMAETARAQLLRMDASWPVEQRDCAGFVRFVYRTAFSRIEPDAVRRGLFHTPAGKAAFADAQTLLSSGSFASLGRAVALREKLMTGDLVAFRRTDGDENDPIYHVMLVVRPQDPAHEATWVIYHPGNADAAVRGGPLATLERDAPREWQPVPENPAFLGYFRYEEWMR